MRGIVCSWMIGVSVLAAHLAPAAAQAPPSAQSAPVEQKKNEPPPPREEPKSIAQGESSPTIAYALALLAVMLILLLVCMPARRE